MSKNYQHYSEEEKYTIIKLRRKNMHPEFIGEAMGRSAQSVRNVISKSGYDFPKLKRRNNKYDKEYVAAWERRWTEGETQVQIAKSEGVSPSFVSQKISKWFHDELV